MLIRYEEVKYIIHWLVIIVQLIRVLYSGVCRVGTCVDSEQVHNKLVSD